MDYSDETCTPREAAILLGVSIKTVKHWGDEGRLPCWRTSGGHRRFIRSALVARPHGNTPWPAWKAFPIAIHLLHDIAEQRERLTETLQQHLPACAITQATDIYDSLLTIGKTPPQILVADFKTIGEREFGLLDTIASNPSLKNLMVILLGGTAKEHARFQEKRGGACCLIEDTEDIGQFLSMIKAYAMGYLTKA